jgi:hypothetical protein
LARNGIKVEALERVRQVGPAEQAAKSNYSIYWLVYETET